MLINEQNITQYIRVLAVPEKGHDQSQHGLGPKTTFLVHTFGLGRFDRRELCFTGVPGQWVEPAVGQLNRLAAASLAHDFKDGQTVGAAGLLPVAFRLSAIEIDGMPMFQLEVEGFVFECSCCDSADPGGPGLH